MKAASFAYARPRSLAEVFALLEAHGDGAKLLAGGQSLVPLLNMRLSAPDVVIDITRVPELSGIAHADGHIHIGALTTHAEVGCSKEIADTLPLLAQAAPQIAHAAIRNVGTFGGSLALGDPSTEWPACCVALDAQILVASTRGSRRTRARDFFKGLYSTDLKADEVLTRVEIPVLRDQYRSTFLELARNAMSAIEGKRVTTEALAACTKALDSDLDPGDGLDTSAATKLHFARVLTERALRALSQ